MSTTLIHALHYFSVRTLRSDCGNDGGAPANILIHAICQSPVIFVGHCTVFAFMCTALYRGHIVAASVLAIYSGTAGGGNTL